MPTCDEKGNELGRARVTANYLVDTRRYLIISSLRYSGVIVLGGITRAYYLHLRDDLLPGCPVKLTL